MYSWILSTGLPMQCQALDCLQSREMHGLVCDMNSYLGRTGDVTEE